MAVKKKPVKKNFGKGPVMPKFRKVPDTLIKIFDSAISAFPTAERRKMFGCPCAFYQGQLFTGLHQESFMLRLGEGDRERAAKLGAVPFEPLPGRKMREYVTLPEDIVQNKTKLGNWLKKSFCYAESLGPKIKKQKK